MGADAEDDAGVSSELLLPAVIRVETALSRFPAHRLSRKGEVAIDIVERAQDGEVKVRWAVSHSSLYGQPGPLAYKIDTLVVNRRIEELPRPVPRTIRLGSLRGLCRELGLADSGKNRSNIREALRQNAFAGVSAKIRYRQRDGVEQSIEADFTRYSVVFTGEPFPDPDGGMAPVVEGVRRRADAVYIILNDIYMNVINGAMTRPLDYEYLKELSAGPQRFYEVMSYRMFSALKHGRPRARLVYSEFCAYAPQVRYFDSNRVHKQMAKVHAPHLESQYIEAIEFEPTIDAARRADWILHYRPGPRARAEYHAFAMKGGPGIVEMDFRSLAGLPGPKPSELEQELVSRGVAEATAQELCAEYTEDHIRQQIEYFDFESQHGGRKIGKPGGYLTSAIRGAFAEPAGYAEAQARKEREEAERARAQFEAARKREQQDEQKRERALQRKLNEYWLGLSTEEQQEFDREALDSADPQIAGTYRAFLEQRNPLATTLFRSGIREPLIKRRLKLPGA
jgi:hypothetical protein